MTDFSTVPGAPRSDNPEVLTALAADLLALNYTVDGVAELLGEQAHQALGRDQMVPAALVLRDRTEPLAAVVKLWLLAEPIPAETLAHALPSLSLSALTALGLIEAVPSTRVTTNAETTQKMVRAAIDLRPYGVSAEEGGNDTNLWVASDLGAHQRPGVLRHDHVLGIGQASLTLAQSTIRCDVDRALDLGTGCGIQLFHLLHYAKTVVATDISARALAFTRFNLLLNAGALDISAADFDPANPKPRVSLRLGSLLEPVVGEKFDAVVSNPPFVITPRHRGEHSSEQFTYRDGGLAGDAIVEQLVRRLPSVLAPGGTAQMLGNWEIQRTPADAAADAGALADDAADDTAVDNAVDAAEDAGAPADAAKWSARPRQWVPAGVQAWFIQREQLSPAGYAETWLQDASQGRDQQAYAAAYEDYLRDFASRAVVGIGFGYILLRKPATLNEATLNEATQNEDEAAPELRFEEILYPMEQPLGPHLAATLARETWLDSKESIRQERLMVAEDVTEERHQFPGAEHPGVILLRQGAGLRRTTLLSTELAGFASASDGELTVGKLIAALAALLERPDAEFADNLYAQVCNLVRDGFLLPV